MATVSNNDIARAIYLVSKDKTESELSPINQKIITFLSKRRLLSKHRDILHKLNTIINRENEKVEVRISSAQKLSEDFKKELASFLRERYKAKEINFLEKLDEGLLGGVRIEVNDEVIDLTAKNKIKKLKEHLTRKI